MWRHKAPIIRRGIEEKKNRPENLKTNVFHGSCHLSGWKGDASNLLRRNPNRPWQQGLVNGRATTTIRSSWQELAGVVVFSALPFSVVKAIANSSLGEALQERMMKTKAAAQLDAEAAKAAQADARAKSLWFGDSRPKFLGPLPFDYPQHLQGESPGDYGFDILGLGRETANFDKFFNFEILHARWAMLGAMGAVIPELLVRYGGLSFSEPVWWRVGYAKLQGETLDYFGIPGLHVAGAQGVLVIAFCQVLLMVGPEYARYCGIEALEPLGVFLPGDINYPGGALFDPLGLSKDPSTFEDLKVKEIKNGRLAMVAWLGFYAQAVVTGKGPVENALDFLSDPAHQNLFAYATSS
ncbi:hypothetical protein AXG93_977s1170 [Marchantia polymorpha subsp. ruderalis]|uniref:Chlorophyll a-b binding protein, chloroplastic n=1 Tax=Marchantia polymorpha subsp. ruderalis TaxID=1480154 RepID=A0A176WD23_MARPO|nr:hypothetical protein AXG93_977s1170 [Marchantia polymorpha subsp. ruderalis]